VNDTGHRQLAGPLDKLGNVLDAHLHVVARDESAHPPHNLAGVQRMLSHFAHHAGDCA
jgi:hypothetical protein